VRSAGGTLPPLLDRGRRRSRPQCSDECIRANTADRDTADSARFASAGQQADVGARRSNRCTHKRRQNGAMGLAINQEERPASEQVPVCRQSPDINGHEAFQARFTSQGDDRGVQTGSARPPEGGGGGPALAARVQELGQRRHGGPVYERNSREPIDWRLLSVPRGCAVAGIARQDHHRSGSVNTNPLNPLFERAGARGQTILHEKPASGVQGRACVPRRAAPRVRAGPRLESKRRTEQPVVDERRDGVVAEAEQLITSAQPATLLIWIICVRNFEPREAGPREIERESADAGRRRHEPICQELLHGHSSVTSSLFSSSSRRSALTRCKKSASADRSVERSGAHRTWQFFRIE
jgi:hypothetical protein